MMSQKKLTKLRNLVIVGLAYCHLIGSSQAIACSTFSFMDSGRAFVGKSYDWDKEQGVLHVNKRGVRKSALQVFPTDRPLTWTSKYGSLTLNQYGRELPNAGINEAGVVVEVMVLGGARFPAPDEKLSVNESQWVQYMLDMAGSTDEVVNLAKQARLSKILIPLHYMACDPTGACVAFEPIEGELVVTDLAARGNKVMTNDTYENGMRYLNEFEGFGGTRPVPSSKGSLDRFVIASDHVKRLSGMNSIEQGVGFAFEGIERVASGATKWRVVYDLDSKHLHFSTQSETSVKKAKVSEFDFSCSSPVKVYNMASGSAGDISRSFKDYSSDDNSRLIRSSLGRSVPEALLRAAENLPSTTECVE